MDLSELHQLKIAPEITTDAKVIPTILAREFDLESEQLQAFKNTVAMFEGSVAIATHNSEQPHELMLALRGSGQSLYIGLADNSYIVASEPYGVVEEASQWIRMDGERPADPRSPISSAGQIIHLRARAAGTLKGIQRIAYDGTLLPVQADEISQADITTRDIDRGDSPLSLIHI
mgnify:FL=1